MLYIKCIEEPGKSEPKMKIRFFMGKWDSWGMGIAFCKYDNSITINLIHWYFAIEVYSRVK
jgi:hypothetical protein